VGCTKRVTKKSVEKCNVSVQRLSSLLGLAALACLFNSRRLGKMALMLRPCKPVILDNQLFNEL